MSSIDGICKSPGYIYVYDDNSMFCVTYYYVHTVMEKLYWFYILNGIEYTYKPVERGEKTKLSGDERSHLLCLAYSKFAI